MGMSQPAAPCSLYKTPAELPSNNQYAQKSQMLPTFFRASSICEQARDICERKTLIYPLVSGANSMSKVLDILSMFRLRADALKISR